MLLLNYLAAVFKLPLCSLLIKRNILQHYAPWFTLRILYHYVNNGSNVYDCLLDASKAFDRIHYGKILSILLSKQVPAFIIRYLLDRYIRQMSRAL